MTDRIIFTEDFIDKEHALEHGNQGMSDTVVVHPKTHKPAYDFFLSKIVNARSECLVSFSFFSSSFFCGGLKSTDGLVGKSGDICCLFGNNNTFH